MADTVLATASQVQKWDSQFFIEYIRDSGFMPYMSRGASNVICAKYELSSSGKTINIPLVTNLSGAGVTGSSVLENAEEAMNNYNHPISIDWKRNGVLLTKDQEHYTEMDMRAAAREILQNWAMDGLRDDVIAALLSKWAVTSGTIGTQVAYGSATEAQKDLWLDRNVDRVLFGASKSNVSTSAPAGGAVRDHSASLLNVDGTNDKLTAAAVTLMKRIAKTASPAIRPIRVNGKMNREYYVLFCGSLPFRDLKNDSVMATANREARARDVETNPIFQDGDLIYDGVIIREIPEIPVLANAGNGGTTDVGPVFLCGAQAVGVAWGQEPRSVTDTRDYGFRRGVGIEEARGVSKMIFNNKDHGVVTGFFAAVADA
jgi:N4-gp56 family major capsid protein